MHLRNPINVRQIEHLVLYSEGSEDRLVLSNTSDAEKPVRLYVGFPGSELSPSSSIRMST